MKIISWNVRGLGGFEKRREVCQLVREKKPFMQGVFILISLLVLIV